MKMEASLNRHLQTIIETEEQLQKTKSIYRKRDLRRYLKRLRQEYILAKQFLEEYETSN